MSLICVKETELCCLAITTVLSGRRAPETSVTTPVSEDLSWAWRIDTVKRNKQASVANRRLIVGGLLSIAAVGACEGCAGKRAFPPSHVGAEQSFDMQGNRQTAGREER